MLSSILSVDNSKKKKSIVLHIGVIALLSLLFALFYFDIIKCPFRAIFGTMCPTCNMTHAVARLFVFDFKGYAELNAMALPTGIAVLFMIHSDKFKGRIKIAVITVSLVILVVNLIYYIVRLLLGII